MNFRNNFYPNNNIHGAPLPKSYSPIQSNMRSNMTKPSMQFNLNQQYRNNSQQRFTPNRYEDYKPMQNNPSFAYENNMKQYDSYGGYRFNNGPRMASSYNYSRGSYGRLSSPINEERRGFINNSFNNAGEEEYYNYNDYSRPMLKNEDSRSSFRSNFFSRLAPKSKRKSFYEDNEMRNEYRSDDRPNRLGRRSKSRYEDEYDDYEDEEDEYYREERHPKKLKKRSKSRYEDEYDDYEDEEDEYYREERHPKKLKKRSKSRYEDEYDDYEDEEDEDYREERHPKKLKKRSKSRYEDEYDDYEDDDRLVERKHRFLPGPINFFKKKTRG